MALPFTISGADRTETSPSALALSGYWNRPSLHASRRWMSLPLRTSPSSPPFAHVTGREAPRRAGEQKLSRTVKQAKRACLAVHGFGSLFRDLVQHHGGFQAGIDHRRHFQQSTKIIMTCHCVSPLPPPAMPRRVTELRGDALRRRLRNGGPPCKCLEKRSAGPFSRPPGDGKSLPLWANSLRRRRVPRQ